MNEFWIARDKTGDIWGFKTEPAYDEKMGMWYADDSHDLAVMSNRWFPDIKPGECRKFVMV